MRFPCWSAPIYSIVLPAECTAGHRRGQSTPATLPSSPWAAKGGGPSWLPLRRGSLDVQPKTNGIDEPQQRASLSPSTSPCLLFLSSPILSSVCPLPLPLSLSCSSLTFPFVLPPPAGCLLLFFLLPSEDSHGLALAPQLEQSLT